MSHTEQPRTKVVVDITGGTAARIGDHATKHSHKPATKPMSQAAARLGQAIKDQL